MIRLLEWCGEFSDFALRGRKTHAKLQGLAKTSKVDAGKRAPQIRERVEPAIHLGKSEAVASAYLRAAQAYILISMPTDTSTIFGAFQAILALLEVNPDELRPANKIIRIKSFVSKILRGADPCCDAQSFTVLCETTRQTNDVSRGFYADWLRLGASSRWRRFG